MFLVGVNRAGVVVRRSQVRLLGGKGDGKKPKLPSTKETEKPKQSAKEDSKKAASDKKPSGPKKA